MQSILNVAGTHPSWIMFAVFLVACAESLAVIGTLVPATFLMFGVGALVGAGSIDIWITLTAAVLGATLGDALSYELGRSRQTQIMNWGLLRRYAQAFARGEAFIRRHGRIHFHPICHATIAVAARRFRRAPAGPAFADRTVDQGRKSRWVFVRWSAEHPAEREVLRMWDAGMSLRAGGAAPDLPIWYGAVYREVQAQIAYAPNAGLLWSKVIEREVMRPLPPIMSQYLRMRETGQAQTHLTMCSR